MEILVLPTIEYHEKDLIIATWMNDRGGEGRVYGHLVNAYQSLVDYRKAIEYHEKDMTIATEMSDRGGEAKAYHNIGGEYFSIEQFQNAVNNFVSAVDVFDTLRFLFKSEDHWKINFR